MNKWQIIKNFDNKWYITRKTEKGSAEYLHFDGKIYPTVERVGAYTGLYNKEESAQTVIEQFYPITFAELAIGDIFDWPNGVKNCRKVIMINSYLDKQEGYVFDNQCWSALQHMNTKVTKLPS